MTVETSRKILKVVGILGIIFGVIFALGGVLMLAGGSLAQQAGEISLTPEELKVMKLGGIASAVLGLITLLEGIFSVRAAKDFSKIMPAWVFALISLIFNAVDAIWSIIQSAEARTIATAAFSIALSILVLGAANKIKNYVGK
jgi:hypothetical protein